MTIQLLCRVAVPMVSVSYSWDFGNGKTSSLKGNATTTFSESNHAYQVKLTITDSHFRLPPFVRLQKQ